MTKKQIIRALQELDKELDRKNIRGEVCVVGGAVMCLAFNSRQSTLDVDAIFEPSIAIQKAAFNVSQKLKLNNFWWLNDAAKEFTSDFAKYNVMDLGLKNLIVRLATAEYMLAMKILAARAGTNDEVDVLFLISHLKLRTKAQLKKVVKKYYPEQKLSLESKTLLDAIFPKK